MSTPSYQRPNDGMATTADDPHRGVWYVAGKCGYWTDDWAKLRRAGGSGVPCCPGCGMVGYVTTAKEWLEGAAAFEERGNPGYLDFVNAEKEACKPKSTWMWRYKTWQVEQAARRVQEQDEAEKNRGHGI